MKTASILSTGEEVLRGELVDTNSQYLAQTLQDYGFSIELMLTVGDRPADLLGALSILHQHSDFVFVTENAFFLLIIFRSWLGII